LKEISFVAGMATAKLNKEKLKRMMEQKDVVPVNLGKKRRGDMASKPSSDKVIVHPPTQQSAPIVQVPAMSVEVIELMEIPSSSRVVDKPPTLALDPLALCRAKSVVTKGDMDDYGKLTMDVVKRALAHSLMKVSCLLLLCFVFYLVIITIYVSFVVCRV
jgi:hypothetical protein